MRHGDGVFFTPGGFVEFQSYALMQVSQFVDRQLNIAQDRTQQTRTNRLTGMYGNCGGPAVGVSEKDMTSAAPVHSEACSFEGADKFFTLEAWKACHTDTC